MEQQLEAIRNILDYHTKLLESLVVSIDENRSRSAQYKSSMGNITDMILKNPVFQKNPEAREFLSGMTESLKNIGGMS